MSAPDALVLLDQRVAECEADPFGILSGLTVRRLLFEVRDALTAGPEWSEVQESNVRAERDRWRRSALAAMDQVDEVAGLAVASELLFEAALGHVEGERDRARATAARLEQENLALRLGSERRAL